MDLLVAFSMVGISRDAYDKSSVTACQRIPRTLVIVSLSRKPSASASSLRRGLFDIHDRRLNPAVVIKHVLTGSRLISSISCAKLDKTLSTYRSLFKVSAALTWEFICRCFKWTALSINGEPVAPKNTALNL